MKLSEILKEINVLSAAASGDTEITGVCYDSRRVKNGDLFVAVRGYESDGHKYIPMAVEKGCAAVLCKAALQAASLNVFINTKLMADRARAAALDARADALLAEFVPRADEVFSAVSGKLRNK